MSDPELNTWRKIVVRAGERQREKFFLPFFLICFPPFSFGPGVFDEWGFCSPSELEKLHLHLPVSASRFFISFFTLPDEVEEVDLGRTLRTEMPEKPAPSEFFVGKTNGGGMTNSELFVIRMFPPCGWRPQDVSG